MSICTAGGLFETQADVNRAIEALRTRGFDQAAFTIIGREGGDVRGDGRKGRGNDRLASAFRTGGSDRLRRTLADLGCTPEEAHYYARGVKNGGLLILVHNVQRDQLDEAHTLLQALGGRIPPAG